MQNSLVAEAEAKGLRALCQKHHIVYLFIYLFLYNNFICKEHRKKDAAREELNPHIRQPPKQIRIKQI